jgi:N-methylhydantoinase A
VSRYRVGVDIGGTFTDIVLLADDGTVATKKVSSSVDDYARAIEEGIAELTAERAVAQAAINEVVHGTTVASNALLERKGARTGLIGTRGFRDILEIRNLRMPRLYDLTWEKPPPLVERYLRAVVDERIDAHGNVQTPLDPADAAAAVDRLIGEGVDAIAVCLLNAFANPTHERALKALIEERAPDCTVCISYEVLPEIKEYERTSTTVINTYISPIVRTYLERLRATIGRESPDAHLLIMQSNGGLTSADEAARRPVNIVESGPAGGVVGALAMAGQIGLDDLITFDMGGTTAKAALIEGGVVSRASDYQVGGGILTGSRLMTGAGYLVKMPSIDLAEVGAGGGSLIAIDAGGAMQVGPESAGAMPGPVCYDQGGTEPTITDANVALGYLNPDHLVGGALRLNAAKAIETLEARIAKPLGVSLEDAAYGAHQIVASNMIRAIRAVSTERGRDPRGYALVAFGGNGPVFAVAMARALGIARVIVPPAPGLFSSFGLLTANVEHHLSRTFRALLRDLDRESLNAAWDELAEEALSRLAGDGFSGDGVRVEREASLHYQGQTYELTVPVRDGALDQAALSALEEAFGAEHERTYGHRAGPEEPVELVTIRVLGRGVRPAAVTPRVALAASDSGDGNARRAYFGPVFGWHEAAVVGRADLEGGRDGPLIVEEYDATCVVPPDATATLDASGHIIIDVGTANVG